MNPKVYCLTSDKYLNSVRGFSYFINKYWKPNPEVVVVGFAEPSFDLPSNFSFLSLGDMKDYPIGNWSDAVIKFLGMIEDSHFVLMFEDYWITRQVDVEAVGILHDYARQFTYTARIDLTGDRLYSGYADLNYGVVNRLDLVKSMPGSPYHMSMMTAIWNRELLSEILIPGESPWDVEINGTPRLAHAQDMLVLGTRQWPVKHTLAHRGGNPNELLLDEIAEVDVKALRELGFIR